jgi:hypothetical protein
MSHLKLVIALLLCSFAASQSIVETNSSILLIPANKTGRQVILLGLNGALCPAEIYEGIFQTVQNYSNYTLWVGLHKFANNIPADLGEAFPVTLQELRDHGANSTDIFVAGHSLGGYVAQDFLYENSTGYKGLILLAKFIRFEYKNPEVNFPLPVLTIGGELDGLSKISRLAMSYNQMLNVPEGEGHIRYPVAIIPGAYHSSYVTGYVPDVINASDIEPEATGPQVWKVCATLINAFIEVHLHSNSSERTEGAKVLFDYVYGYTYSLMRPLIEAFALEGNPYLYNLSVVNTTKWVSKHIFDEMDVSPGILPTLLNCTDIADGTEFYKRTPSATFRNEILDYRVYTNKDIGPVESDDLMSSPNQSALWIATKYKSPDYIIKTAKLQWTASQITCKMLNEKVIRETMATIPEKTLARFQKWGVRLRAGDDIDYSNNDSWNASSAVYDDHVGYIDFQSSKLLTKTADGGEFYCKLLSPGKVAEWVYVDGLKRYDGAGLHNGTQNTTRNTSSSSSFFPSGGIPGLSPPGGN